jgi:hypothetical protein
LSLASSTSSKSDRLLVESISQVQDTVTNSKPVPHEFTFTILPHCQEYEFGVSVNQVKVVDHQVAFDEITQFQSIVILVQSIFTHHFVEVLAVGNT